MQPTPERVSPQDHVDVAARLALAMEDRRDRYGVIGLGYVGLPLAIALADASVQVLGFDIDASRVATINAGGSYISDVPSQTVQRLVADQKLGATTDMTRLREMDVISICVPTPLSKMRDPDISHVVAATQQVGRSLRSGQLVILESTTYPGTTRDVLLPILLETGLQLGTDFFLAFSPERIDPGNAHYGIRNTPKVAAGLDEVSTRLTQLFYGRVIERVVAVSSPEAAEMVKLLENTFRSVNIALANETALMCARLGLDVWEVTAAAATKPFGFMAFYPGPGLGGHCVPLDPFYLSWKMKTLDYRARFIELAGEINSAMPDHIVGLVVDGLNDRGKAVRDAGIVVLGVAYKADVDDARESPAIDIISLLQRRGARVSYCDPHVPAVELPSQTLDAEPLTRELLAAADCIVIVTPHAAFDYELVARHAVLVVDTRNALEHVSDVAATVVKL